MVYFFNSNISLIKVIVWLQHDPITIFGDHPPEMTLQSINVHKQCIQLASNLRLVGFGGSVPGFQHGKQIWDGML